MAVLEWDKIGERLFEVGVRKGVLYKDDGYGVVWNGITSVDEGAIISLEPLVFDGIKYADIISVGDFNAVLKAFTYPDEFLKYEGVIEDQSGFFFTGQPLSTFGLSYQTTYGNDIHGSESGYKIHLLYNLKASPSDKNYSTISDSIEATEFEWNITSIPEEIEGFRPTAHVIFDSRKMDSYLFADIEAILYGSEDNEAYLPSLQALAALTRSWSRLVITEHEDGSWTAFSPIPGTITMLDSTTFQIVSETATYLDADTYEITSSPKNDDDIWLPPM